MKAFRGSLVKFNSFYLLFVIECRAGLIQQNKKDKPEAGQIIYSELAVADYYFKRHQINTSDTLPPNLCGY
ncbi:hypothetical protein GCM10010992_25990 [Cloacibacterium rupense]|uniref:Uncharacterized protein n=1 Tax=Cloacibacterium rupense TaxID=517423 RepID=A0ABQ2NSR3_9FLAO|nr:hypothetical protein [Cloacibacterium rupense]GGP06306.1 hypothetical protein GCM10010992_25990 [Cloacibacterium rupense]